MAATLATPGVYIEEKSSFGSSVVPVQTAIPVQIPIPIPSTKIPSTKIPSTKIPVPIPILIPIPIPIHFKHLENKWGMHFRF